MILNISIVLLSARFPFVTFKICIVLWSWNVLVMSYLSSDIETFPKFCFFISRGLKVVCLNLCYNLL